MDPNIIKDHFPKLATYPALISLLSEKGILREFPAGQAILQEGAYVSVIPLLVSGLAKVFREDGEGNEVLLYYIKPGESCIMSVTSCSRNEKSNVKAVIEEDARLLLIPAETARDMSRDFSHWNDFVFGLFNEKYEELLQAISILTFSKKDVRLLSYLKRESEVRNSQTIQTTHQKIADDLGSSREVISRLLKKLENEGKLALGHGWVRVLEGS
ncbi:MAG: Crp/Fnr family transcriptional regulator [Bacteroidota bacterium]